MPKQVIQIGGAILSAVYNIGSLIADAQSWFPAIQWQYHAIVGFLIFTAFMIWIIWDKQSQISSIQGGIRLEARMHGVELPYSRTLPSVKERLALVDDGKGIEVPIDLVIWTDRDIHTDNLVLNIVSARISSLLVPWWQIWEVIPRVLNDFPAFKRTVGLRLEKGEYRKYISNASKQPFTDTVTFKLQGEGKARALSWSNTFMMELVLVCGMPNIKCRTYLGWKSLMRKPSEPV